MLVNYKGEHKTVSVPNILYGIVAKNESRYYFVVYMYVYIFKENFGPENEVHQTLSIPHRSAKFTKK